MKNPQIGLWPAIALVAGNMIGSGIFLLPATLAVFGYFSLYITKIIKYIQKETSI
jgi:APA family basic amino acid/polyamine antiporter